MKSIIILLSLLTVNFTYAAEAMTQEEQTAYLKDVAKNIRRTYWVSGHDHVDSSTELMTKQLIDEHVRKETNETFEEPLTSEQIANLYRCHYRESCALYHVSASSEYWGGYGMVSHFILLDVYKRNHDEISHIVYAE